MEVIGGVSSVVTLVEVAGKIGLLCAKYITEVRDAKNEAERIMKETRIFIGLLNEVEDILDGPLGMKLKASQALKDALRDSEQVLVNLESDLERGLKEDEKPRNFLKKMTKGLRSEALKWPFKKKDVEEVIKNLRELKTTITLALQIDNISIVAFRDQRMNLDKLPVVKEAIFGSLEDQHEPHCLPQTRTEILKGVKEWAVGPRDRDSCIFWLRGMAGTGKSTIACTVAQYLKENNQLGASFFFKRSQAQRSSASRFFPTLAYGLAQHIPSLVQHMSKAIEGDPEVSERSFKEQFEKLLFEPLSKVGSTPTVVLVIDALDECENELEIPLLLGFLGQLSKLEFVDLRMFITSRPEFGPLTGFQKLSRENVYCHDLALHDVAQETVKHDISAFFKHKFAEIQSNRQDELPGSWPGEGVIQQLTPFWKKLEQSSARSSSLSLLSQDSRFRKSPA
ncbi:hypothetical protein ABW20_dc0102150 [Dactylellina cionopaga]|nr:hypothetical protein ABW20_dc0102150 [Dactylellina cionopaga]